MTRFLKGRSLPAAVLALVTAAAILLAGRNAPAGLPGPEDLPDMGWEAAEAALLGLPRRDVLNAWGQPDKTLSGLFGDIYTLEDGGRVVLHYDTELMGRGAADEYTVPAMYVSCPVTVIPPLEDISLPRVSDILEGHTREEVHDAWGSPHSVVTWEQYGYFCDVYRPDEFHGIAVYYNTWAMDAGTADERTVPVLYVSLSEA